MSKVIKADFAFSTDGVWASSCEFELSDDTLAKIEKGKVVINENDFLDSVSISEWQSIKQFDSTLDDEDNKEIPYEDDSYFRSDVMIFIVSRFGVTLRCFGKWDSGQYFEVNID